MSFKDVPVDDPLAPVLDEVTQLGLLSGYTDGTFRPDTPVSRRELAFFCKQLADRGMLRVQDYNQETLYQRLAPAVVTLYATTAQGQAVGAGVMVDGRGYVVTCHHVIDGATALTARWFTGQTTTATVVWPEPESDLAWVHVDTVPAGAIPVEIAQDNVAPPGMRVMAIGAPLGDPDRMSVGEIGAARKVLNYYNAPQQMLDVSAVINHGNSGGGLFDMTGRLIGITSMKMLDAGLGIEGMSFAIDAATVRLSLAVAQAKGAIPA